MPPVYKAHCSGNVPFSINLVTGQGVWDFDIINDGGNIYLGNGWADFRDACNMSLFDMIVFAFDDPSIINVALFKADGSENECNFDVDDECGRAINQQNDTLLCASEALVLENISNAGKKRTFSEMMIARTGDLIN